MNWSMRLNKINYRLCMSTGNIKKRMSNNEGMNSIRFIKNE